MPTFKVSFDFTFRKSGWTETYYNSYADIRTSLESAKGLLLRRGRLLGGTLTGENPVIETIRVSDVAVQRDALQYKIPGGGFVNKDANGSPDNEQLSVAVRCEATDKYRRTLFLAGNPDACCQDGKYFPVPTWENAFQEFTAFLLARPWGIYAQKKTTPSITIVDISAPVDGVVTITTDGAHGFAIGDTVQILKAPGMQRIRGKYFVKDILLANGFKIRAAPTGAYSGGGKVRKVDMELQNFTNLEIDGITRKSRGRPLGGPVGRRRRRVVA